MSRISVSSLGVKLSLPLPVIALVGRYPANKLIGPKPIPKRLATLERALRASYKFIKSIKFVKYF